MKKIIFFTVLILASVVGFSQCHTYDTANVNTQNIGGNIDSITLQSKFYVVETGSPLPMSLMLKSKPKTIIYKVPSTYTGLQMINYSDSVVYKWVQTNYVPW